MRLAQQTINNWFNKDNVVVPTDLSHPFGDAKRHMVRGPAFWSTYDPRQLQLGLKLSF
jgi:hypothetical protein